MELVFALLFSILCGSHAIWVKEMENEGAFEGDIILRPDEKEEANGYASIKGGRWPNAVIPYDDSSISFAQRSSIMAAFKQYHKHTCLRFVKRTNQRAYIKFYSGRGCSSPIGYRGGVNSISLAFGCRRTGIVMHEIGHSIGLYHEQSRPDRDQYVEILWNNIKSGHSHNFRKHSLNTIDSLGTPYDFGSMMHYGSGSFAKLFTQTIRVRNGSKIGQRNGFSKIDKIQINKMYCNGGSTCTDSHSRCEEWKKRGECEKNPNWMKPNCKKSCKQC